MQKSKEKRKNKSRRLRLTWGYILPPITAFLILIVPPFFPSEKIINYLFSDRLIYPLAYILSHRQLHFALVVLLLILWIAIRIIRYRQFFLEVLIAASLFIMGVLFGGGVVWSYKTTEILTLNDSNYYLRQAEIHDYSDIWSQKTGNYDFVHKCDFISIFCETVFLQHTNLWHVEHRELTMRIEDNQLLLVYISNDTNQIDQVVATIEDNLDGMAP